MDSRIVSPLLMWAIALAGAALLLAFAPSQQLFQKNPYTGFLFAILFTNWLGFFSLALWENRQAADSASGIRKLVKTGVYSLVRHPIYFADMFLAFGIFLFSPNLNVLLAALFVSLLLYRWAMLEEAALGKKFGREYAQYCKKVPRLLPRTV